jgi:predicted CopG family antitoxin
MHTKKIQIKKETYKRLIKKGKQGDTIDEIINTILESIDRIETRDMKETQSEKSVMNLRTTKRLEWIPHRQT